MLTFDEEKHEYRWNGRVVPSVTQVLKAEGFYGDFDGIDEYYLHRGTAIHLATHLDDQADLDESTLDDSIKPFLEAWRGFRAVTGFVPDATEVMEYSEFYGFAGTMDRTGFLNNEDVIIDIKGPAHSAVYGIQLAAYHLLKYGISIGQQAKRISIHLSKDAQFRVHEYPTEDFLKDADVFLSALNLYKWKQENLCRK